MLHFRLAAKKLMKSGTGNSPLKGLFTIPIEHDHEENCSMQQDIFSLQVHMIHHG